jgi:hypothetical protein
LRNAHFVLASVIALSSPAFAQEATDPKKPEEVKKDTDADAAIKKQLETVKVNLNLDATPFGDAVGLLHDITKVDFVIDSLARDVVDNEEVKVSLKQKGALLKDGLDALLKKASANLTYEVWKGTVWITTNAGVALKPADSKVDAATAKKLEAKVKLEVENESLADVFGKLKTEGKVPFSAAKEIDTAGVKVTLQLHDAKLADVIDIMSRLLGFAAEGKDGAVVFSPRADK